MSRLEKRVEVLENSVDIDAEGAARQYVSDLICAAYEGRPVPDGPWPAGASKAFADLVIEAWRGKNEQPCATC